MWKAVKYRAHNFDFTELLWPEKKTAEMFKMLMEEAKRDGMMDGYSQEYLNYPIDESTAYFKRTDFIAMKEGDKEILKNYYITADLAISEKERADFSVFVVAGIDEDKRMHVVDVIRERLDGREIVDLILSLERAWQPMAIGIEEMQVSKAIGPFLREEMVKQSTYPSLVQLKHGGQDKQMRGRSIQARMRAKGVRFDKEADWYPRFEDELLTFPRGRNDDQVDAFAYMGLMLQMLVEAPTQKELEDEEYEEELRESELAEAGRSEVTGY